MINKFKNKKGPPVQSGFTVLESIVAIFILSLSISGAFSAVQQSLSQSIIAKDEVKAFYLAQEAIEIIRNRRDYNQLARIPDPTNPTISWLDGIAKTSADPCWFGKTCRVDAKSYYPNNPQFVDCSGDPGGKCPVLNQDTSTFLYNYDTVSQSNIATNFKREIQIESITPDEIAVTVKISWNKGLIPESFTVKTLLFDWI